MVLKNTLKINTLGYFKKNYFIVILIISVVLLRFFNAFDWFFWNVDEDIHALSAKRILIDHKPTLIGVTLPNGIHLGPGFFYIEAFFLFLSRMNPFVLPIISSIIAVGMAILIYLTANIIFQSRRIAIFTLIIFSFSYLINVYSRLFHPLIFAPLLACLVYLFLYKILEEKKLVLLPVLGVVIAYSFHGEGTPISLIILTILSWVIWKYKISAKNILTLILIFLVSLLPVILFEFRHNFIQTQRLINSLNQARKFEPNINLFISVIDLLPQTMSRLVFASGSQDVASQILQCPDLKILKEASINPLIYLGIIILLVIFVFNQIIKRPKSFGEKIISLHLLIVFVGLLLFNVLLPGYIPEWSMMILFPAMIFIIAIFLDQAYNNIKLRFFIFIILGFFITSNLILTLKGKGAFSLQERAQATKFAVSQLNGEPYSLDSLGSCYAQGYNYLFWYYGYQPKVSYSDNHLSPTYYNSPQFEEPQTSVVIVNPSENESENFWKEYRKYEKLAYIKKSFKNIEVLIIKNRDEEF